MAVNYNFLKSLKGTAIGTIVPWTGDLTQIPKGWVQCKGQELNVSEFPYLYEIMGIKYGGVAGNTFKLPNIGAKSLVDYHTSHDNISTIPSSFQSLIDDTDDTANEVNPVRNSNIDLFASYNQNINTFLGFVTGVTLNDPVFFDGLATGGRALGDWHIGTHAHGGGSGSGTVGTGTFDVVGAPSQWAEECQNNGNANCFLFCPDDCGSPQYDRMEANTPSAERQRIGVFDGNKSPFLFDQNNQSLVPTDFYSGKFLTRPNDGSYSGFGALGWATRRNPGQNQGTNYNYVDPVNMDVECSIKGGQDANLTNSPWSYAAVDTSHSFANFVNSGDDTMSAHTHPVMFYSITKGSMNVPSTLVINNVTRGNMTPVNASNTAIGTVAANMQTPQLSVLHIIRAY